jgi:mRNA interferase MazF
VPRTDTCLEDSRVQNTNALPTTVGQVQGAVLVDQIKSLDWNSRNAEFHSKADPALLSKARTYLAVLLGIR